MPPSTSGIEMTKLRLMSEMAGNTRSTRAGFEVDRRPVTQQRTRPLQQGDALKHWRQTIWAEPIRAACGVFRSKFYV